MRKMNLGCGHDFRFDFINIDKFESEFVDIIHDLEVFPYPFIDNSFDYILADNIIEHLSDTEKVFKELVRICENNGIIDIYVPHFRSVASWGDITHKTAFSSDSFKNYDVNLERTKAGLENREITLIREKVKIGIPGVWRWLGIEYLINLNDRTREIYEKYFSGFIIPINLNFKLRILK